MKTIRITVWNENVHEKTDPKVTALYPTGLHGAIAAFLSEEADFEVRTATLDAPDQGLSDEVLENTDVLIWWGHCAHGEVSDALIPKIQRRVYLGKMGFIALHSAHHSKPFKALLGTTGNLTWGRNQKEVVWTMLPGHPIAEGIPPHFILPDEELYAEPFFVPQPTELVFGGWYEDGYIFRSGMTFLRDQGRIFYFQPGHETCPSFHDKVVQQIIKNAVRWVAPTLTYEIKNLCPHAVLDYDTRAENGTDMGKYARPPLL